MVYVGADTAAAGSGLVWVRRTAFTLAAEALAVAGLRRLRRRIRPAVTVPAWVNPLTAAVLGLFMTGADLPNAFPYLLAIERIADADADADADVDAARSVPIAAGHLVVAAGVLAIAVLA